MHKKSILIIVFITLLTYGNVLQNDFVGDDEVVIVRNTFYRSWSNLPRLFQKDYITQSDNALLAIDQDNGSGSVAYRPVLSLTYFIDYGIWQKNPFGYHLTNLLLHAFNALLVYFLFFFLTGRWGIALLGAILFSVHPIQAEAVCNIGYRADVLSAFFALLSFVCFVRHDSPATAGRNLWYGASLVSFFLALFSKESVIVLPLLLLCYDFYISNRTIKNVLQNLLQRYGGYFVIAVFYAYVYCYVFPNSTLAGGGILWMDGKISAHLTKMGLIFLFYVRDLVAPFAVVAIPPFYAPPIAAGWGYKIFAAVSILLLIGVLIFKKSDKQKIVPFLLLWFLIALLPVSQIVPIVTPMAHRFLYLPSVGFLAVLAIAIEKITLRLTQNKDIPSLGKIFQNSVVAVCMIFTFVLNAAWKGSYTIAMHWIDYYPKNPQGYFIAGVEYLKAGFFNEAKIFLERSLALGMEDPRLYHSLGLVYLKEPAVAKQFFARAVESFPFHGISYIGLGRSLLFEGDYTKALLYLKKSLELMPSYTGYGYLMQTLLFLNRAEELPEVLREAQKVVTDKEQIESLQKFMSLPEPLKEPIDIGL
ncbi:MAG: hypothetical protein A2787_07715 [Omnitrophica WOR_2 bacterium RIFCSPHIGHO2_01_FULL_48_9]|nr:MAG: hypothetical protein A3D10_04495 [Omnitrophica WOR_2 bacterium RIFCSPHIGHO2_02_FULL_48_11]OGX32577.1 MAG: hypothetical protein A2787_07715 [Omnitrophica WOR_2 bacterium RIFCSPHIGHO2_01_FULL_48_9]